MAIVNFPINPIDKDINALISIKPMLNKVSFGNGIIQVKRKGTKPTVAKTSLEFVAHSVTERNTLKNFLDGLFNGSDGVVDFVAWNDRNYLVTGWVMTDEADKIANQSANTSKPTLFKFKVSLEQVYNT